MGYLSKRKNEERERYLLIILLMAIPLITLLGTMGRSMNWRIDLLGEFKVQAALLSFLLFFWCMYKRFWYAASMFILLAAFNLALVSSRYHLTEKATIIPVEGHSLRFLYQDLKGADDKGALLENILDRADADVVLWSNVPVEIYRHLNDIKGSYSLQNQTHDKHGNMMLFLSRTPSTARGEVPDNAGLWVSRVLGTRKLTLVMTSLGRPWSEKSYEEADNKVRSLASFAQSRDEPVVLVGGFGATGWSYLLKSLETDGGLSPKGTVVLTYPATLPFFMRRPTDHVYTHPGIDVVDMDTVDIGTKQLGLLATVRIAPERREVEFYELQPTLPEEELLEDPL